MTLSLVTPYLIEVLPEELFPTIPPIIHRLDVEVFGPKKSPKGFKNKFSSSLITPGSTTIVLLSSSKAIILVKCFDTSTIIPSPTHCPAKEVPAVLGIKVIPFDEANSIKTIRSLLSFGYATAKGGFISEGNNFALGGKGEAEPAGFIGGPPEQFNDQTTIADDIPLKVKDGTFVINAPAVEYEGSPSIQKMLAEGYEKAMTRDIGVDKNFRIGKIPSREELDIQISRGEVVVPPHVAKAIGYDRLEKINNRGKREVERRQKAGNQEKVQAGQGFAAEGGNQKVTIFRGEPYPEQIGDFDKKYMSGRRMTGAWFSSNKNYAKNY